MNRLLIIIIITSFNLMGHCGGCGVSDKEIHTHINENKIAEILMKNLYGNYDIELQTSSFSFNDIFDDLTIKEEDRTTPYYYETFNKLNIVKIYTHNVYGDLLILDGGMSISNHSSKTYNPKFEGMSLFNSDGEEFYIAIISLDTGQYNVGFSVFQTTFTYSDNKITIINKIDKLAEYPNRYKSSLISLNELENQNIELVSQYGRSGSKKEVFEIINKRLKKKQDLSK